MEIFFELDSWGRMNTAPVGPLETFLTEIFSKIRHYKKLIKTIIQIKITLAALYLPFPKFPHAKNLIEKFWEILIRKKDEKTIGIIDYS